jgi:hypothetical protein
MLQKPGAALDREVARKLGEEGRGPAPFSTDLPAAERLIARLERSGIFTECERDGSVWYCALLTDIGKVRERLATGAGATRPEALCRAVVNLPGGWPLAGPVPPPAR